MFKLESRLHKRARGVKLLAEVSHVSISDYVITIGADDTPESRSIEATIVLYGDRECFYLGIPDDKLASVIERLQIIQDRRIAAQLKGTHTNG